MLSIFFPASLDNRLIRSIKHAYITRGKAPTFYDFFSGRVIDRLISCRPVVHYVARRERIARARAIWLRRSYRNLTDSERFIIANTKSTLFACLSKQGIIECFSVLNMPTEHPPTAPTSRQYYSVSSNGNAHYRCTQLGWRQSRGFIQFPKDILAPAPSGYKQIAHIHNINSNRQELHMHAKVDKYEITPTIMLT